MSKSRNIRGLVFCAAWAAVLMVASYGIATIAVGMDGRGMSLWVGCLSFALGFGAAGMAACAIGYFSNILEI